MQKEIDLTIVHGFQPDDSCKKEKGISRGGDWCRFQHPTCI